VASDGDIAFQDDASIPMLRQATLGLVGFITGDYPAGEAAQSA